MTMAMSVAAPTSDTAAESTGRGQRPSRERRTIRFITTEVTMAWPVAAWQTQKPAGFEADAEIGKARIRRENRQGPQQAQRHGGNGNVHDGTTDSGTAETAGAVTGLASYAQRPISHSTRSGWLVEARLLPPRRDKAGRESWQAACTMTMAQRTDGNGGKRQRQRTRWHNGMVGTAGAVTGMASYEQQPISHSTCSGNGSPKGTAVQREQQHSVTAGTAGAAETAETAGNVYKNFA